MFANQNPATRRIRCNLVHCTSKKPSPSKIAVARLESNVNARTEKDEANLGEQKSRLNALTARPTLVESECKTPTKL